MNQKGSGWLTFAAIILIVAGIGNFFWGVTAVAYSDFLIDQMLFASMANWGWICLIWGIIQFAAGICIVSKVQWARWFGIISSIVSIIFMLCVIWAFPTLSVVIMTLDVLVIYGLSVYGGPEETTV